MSHGSNHHSVVVTPKEHFEIIFMPSILFLGYLLGVYGYYHAFEELYGHANLADCFYDALGLLELKLEFHEHVAIPLSLEFARWIVAITLLWAGVRLVYSIVKNYFKLAWIGLFKKQNTVVIFGATEVSNHLALNILKKKEQKVIIVDSDSNNHYLESLSHHGAVFIVGHPSDESIIKKSLARDVGKVLCMTNDDSLNLKIFKNLVTGNNINIQNVYIHIGNRILYDVIAQAKDEKFGIKKIFNVYSNAARQLFFENPVNKYVDTTQDGNQVRIAILGDSNLAKEVLFHAMNMGGFYNKSKLHLSLVSDNYKHSNEHLLYALDLESKLLQDYFEFEYLSTEEFYKNNKFYNHVVIAIEDQNCGAVETIRCINKFKQYIIQAKESATVVISMYSLDNISGISDGAAIEFNNSQVKVGSFGGHETHFVEDVIIDAAFDGRAAYNDYIYNISHNFDKEKSSPGVAQSEFKKLNVFLQDSNRALADHIVTVKLYEYLAILNKSSDPVTTTDEDIINEYYDKYKKDKELKNKEEIAFKRITNYGEVRKFLTLEQISGFAAAEHSRWNIFHLTHGWNTLKLEQDERKLPQFKLHTCLVDWEQLDKVSAKFEHNYKIDDMEAVFKIPEMIENCKMDSLLILIASELGYANTVTKLLKSKPIDVNCTDKDGKTALMIACSRGYSDVVTELLKSKTVDVNCTDKDGKTALQITEECKYEKIVDIIKDHISN